MLPEGLSNYRRKEGVTSNIPPYAILGPSALGNKVMNRNPMMERPSAPSLSEGMECVRGFTCILLDISFRYLRSTEFVTGTSLPLAL